jgi:hypothetical protein
MNNPKYNTKYNIPTPGERCACPQPRVAKRAALLFDRIYVWPWIDKRTIIPSSIKFDVPKVDDLMNTRWNELKDQLLHNSPKLKNPISMFTADDTSNIIDELFVRIRVECLWLSGHSVTPVYERQERYLSDYPIGNTLVYQAALENLPEIIEDDVSWSQIIEFRSDKDAIRKYRELRLWLEYSLSAKSVEHARDLIASRIEDYEWAIRKHGLKTTTGALSSIFSWEGLISLGAGAGIGAALGGAVWSALTGALFTVGRASVWVAERMIELQDIKRGPDAAVALICDAKRLVRSDNT